MTNRFKTVLFDVKLLSAIATAMASLALLCQPELTTHLFPSEIGRGKLGAQIVSMALSPTSILIATTNTAGRVTLRAKDSGWQSERFLDFPGYAKDVAFSPDGRFLAAVGYGPGICLWDLTASTRKPTETIGVPIELLNHVKFLPDGLSLVATSGFDGTIHLWKLATRQEWLVLHQPSPVTSISFSPDGRWLATGGIGSQVVILWDLRTGNKRVLLEDEWGTAVAVAFSPDGGLLASASNFDRNVRVWDLKIGGASWVLRHARSVNSIAFSSDGALMATACNDGSVGLWAVATGQRRLSLDSQALSLRTVAFSPDGQTLVLATGDDDDIRSWDIAELLRTSPGPYSSPMKIGSLSFSHRL